VEGWVILRKRESGEDAMCRKLSNILKGEDILKGEAITWG
jgi:hypothetical protein